MSTNSGKALFLDRDGVVNINHGYVFRPQDIEFIEGIFELCRQAQSKGYRIVIVTNQSGIARKYYSQHDFQMLTKWLEHQFWRRGIKITHTFYCPHHPQATRPYGLSCSCRKPRPGMLNRAQRYYRLDLANSIMVGDSLSDMLCAKKAGLKKGVLFQADSLQCPPKFDRPKLGRAGSRPYFQARSLRAISQLL